jgi:glycosyltransferase involved in cell wall biosynthesis
MRTAIICDWLVTFAGAETVTAAILDLYPDADLFAVVDFLSTANRARLQNKTAQTTFIQKLPFAKKRYRSYLPLMPLAIEQLNLKAYDLIISSSHAVAKGVIIHPHQTHISYVHTPMRYAWDMQHAYLKNANFNFLLNTAALWFLHRLRQWDLLSAARVDHFIANSHFIAKRIHKLYRREATVIHPPVDTQVFNLNPRPKEDFYLCASRLVPYKKIDLIAETFKTLPTKQLVIIGAGPDFHKIKKYECSNIRVLGYQNQESLVDYMQRAKAFIFAAEEDFGCIPVEAQAAGTPVIAFGRGGALETVRDLSQTGATGIFFETQTVTAIQHAIQRFETNAHLFTKANCRTQAERFAPDFFKNNFKQFVSEKLANASA